MPAFLHHFFHNETNDRTEKGLVRIPKDTNDWPEAWKKIEYKRYALFGEIALSQENGSFFRELLAKRRSSEGYILGNKLTLLNIASILRCGYGLQGGEQGDRRKENRTVPSGGKLYPLEIYLILFKQVDNCRPGVYHYGVERHVLEPVFFDDVLVESIPSFSPIEWLKNTQAMICISSVFSRSVQKYGSRGYRYILLEAGHVAQNMLLAGTEHKVNIVPIGAINEEVIEKKIGLTTSSEKVVYTLFL